jgi:hypothetical protein
MVGGHMKQIRIKRVLNGFVAKVGVQELIYDTADKLVEEVAMFSAEEPNAEVYREDQITRRAIAVTQKALGRLQQKLDEMR